MPPAVENPPPAASDAGMTKRLKKREIDRRCQREARQRTKSRIAYLEGLVEELRRKDTSGQVASLMKQVADVRKERDMFARTLRSIEDSIRNHRPTLSGVPAKVEPDLRPSAELRDRSISASDHLMPDVTVASHGPVDSWPAVSPPPAVNFAPAGGSNASRAGIAIGSHPGAAAPWEMAPSLIMPYGPERPRPLAPGVTGNCECCERLSPKEVIESTTTAMQQNNVWRFAHTVLDQPPQMSPKVLRWEDENSDDVPVRAIAEGWHAAEARLGGHLPPIWRKLRRIDEVVFGEIGAVERLAILRVMHWLMRYHSEPTSQTATVPAWYLARPSQNLSHAYALDFFTWPGLRERFMFSPHAYCSNAFWRMHNAHLRILWQYDFRDCYTVNRHTGEYQLSYAFEERIGDINAWTMKSDFFKRWPELYGDIPSFETIGLPMDNISPSRARRPPLRPRPRPILPTAPVTVVEEVADEEPTNSTSLPPTTTGVKDVPTSRHEVTYDHAPSTTEVSAFRAPAEVGTADGSIYMPASNDAFLSMLPQQLSGIWDAGSTVPMPEPEWPWWGSGMGNETQESS